MRSDAERLQDILAAADAALSFAQLSDREQSNQDVLLAAITYQLIIIGEASGTISEETQARFPDLPWRRMIGMRHYVVHAYWSVDSDNVWGTVETDLPGLVTQLRRALRGS